MKPAFTVGVVTYNAGSTLRRCLSSIFEQDYPRDLYEVLIVDAGSRDDTLKIAEEFPARTEIEEGCTRGRARNICIDKARGQIIAMIDADIVLPEGWLVKLSERFKDPSVGFASCPYFSPMPDLGFIGRIIYYVTSGWAAARKGVEG